MRPMLTRTWSAAAAAPAPQPAPAPSAVPASAAACRRAEASSGRRPGNLLRRPQARSGRATSAVAVAAAAPASAGRGRPAATGTPPTALPCDPRLRAPALQGDGACAQTALASGQGELLWRHDGSSYDAKLEAQRAAAAHAHAKHSTGQITAEGLAPLRFSDKARSEEAAHFERDKGKVSFSSNRPDAPLLAGAQDRLSVHAATRRDDRAASPRSSRRAPPSPSRPPARATPSTGFSRSRARNSCNLPGGTVERAQADPQPAQGIRPDRWNSGWLPAWITSLCACV